MAVLGLVAGVLGAAGSAQATGEEYPFSFSQAGEPNVHPGDLIETTMVGKGAIGTEEGGSPEYLRGGDGKIVYHESHLIGADVDMRFTVLGAKGNISAGRDTVELEIFVAESNDSGCPVESEGKIVIDRQGDLIDMAIGLCGKTYHYTGKVGKNSRLKASFGKPQRCLTGLAPCPVQGALSSPPVISTKPTSTKPTTTTAPVAPTELTLKVNSATSTVNLKTGQTTNHGSYAYGNYNVIPTQTQPGQALAVSASVDAPLPKGLTIEVTWTGSSTPICTTATEETCSINVSYPASAVNVTIDADIHTPTGSTTGASIIAAANPNCTDGKTASQDGGSCPASR